MRLKKCTILEMMQILGLDIGDKTVGVAKSDPLGYTAQPVTTIRYVQAPEACKKLAQIHFRFCCMFFNTTYFI